MNFWKCLKVLLAVLLVAGSCGPVLAQSVTKKALERLIKAESAASLRETAAASGVLRGLEQMDEQGKRISEALKREAAAARAQASQARQDATTLAQKMREVKRILHTPIIPTASNRLPALGHPFIGREYEFSQMYTKAMEEFLAFRKDFNGRMFYEPAHLNMVSEERRRWINRLSPIHTRLSGLKKLAYPKDEPLDAAIEYLNLAAGEINPMLKGAHVPLIENRNRRYVREEFFMDETWFHNIARMAYPAPKMELPAKLKVAVINDEDHALTLYRVWQTQGIFKDWEISYYKRTDPLLKDIFSGKRYDLIITDLQVDESSVEYTVSRLRAAGLTVPVILCSSYTQDSVNPDLMFRQGFDGYVSWSDVASGGVSVLTDALKRYFFYRDYYKWAR